MTSFLSFNVQLSRSPVCLRENKTRFYQPNNALESTRTCPCKGTDFLDICFGYLEFWDAMFGSDLWDGTILSAR